MGENLVIPIGKGITKDCVQGLHLGTLECNITPDYRTLTFGKAAKMIAKHLGLKHGEIEVLKLEFAVRRNMNLQPKEGDKP